MMITTKSNIQVLRNHNFVVVVVVIYIIPSKVMYTMISAISAMSIYETAEEQYSESV